MWSSLASSLLTCSLMLAPLASGPISAMIERTINLTAAYSPDRMAMTPTATATHAWTSILLFYQSKLLLTWLQCLQNWAN